LEFIDYNCMCLVGPTTTFVSAKDLFSFAIRQCLGYAGSTIRPTTQRGMLACTEHCSVADAIASQGQLYIYTRDPSTGCAFRGFAGLE